jgi:hypothetical protein
MPAPITTPWLPVGRIVSVKLCENAAPIVVLAASVGTEHVTPLGDAQFIQRSKLEPLAGVAVSVTLDVVNVAAQVVPQSIARSLDRTDPVPPPARVTVTIALPVPPSEVDAVLFAAASLVTVSELVWVPPMWGLNATAT